MLPVSSGGETPFGHALEAARPLLEGKPDALVAYLPAADLQPRWVRATKAAFRGLAGVTALNVERHSPARMRAVLDKATLLFVPGGNTYLIAHRLHTAALVGLIDELRQRILAVCLGRSAQERGGQHSGPPVWSRQPQFDWQILFITAHYPSEDTCAGRERMQEYLALRPHNPNMTAWLESRQTRRS
jgi:hypothetical protein